MNTSQTKLIFCFLLATCSPLFAFGYSQSSANSGFPGDWLSNSGVSARGIAQGGAFSTSVDDVSSLYWNPSGLAKIDIPQVSFFYSSLVSGADMGFAGYGRRTKNGGFGIGLLNLGISGIEKRDSSDNFLGNFKDTRNCFFIGYSRRYRPDTLIGVNLKIISHKLDSYSDNGLGLDIGIWHSPAKIPFLKTSLLIENAVHPALQFKNREEKYPTNVRFGFLVETSRFASLSFDAIYKNIFGDYTQGATTHPLLWFSGVEINFGRGFFARVGMNYKEMTAGFGLRWADFVFDYAFSGSEEGITHYFTATLRLGLSPEEEAVLSKIRSKRKIDALMEELEFAYGKKDYKRCMELSGEVLKIDPGNIRASEILHNSKKEYNFAESRKMFEKGLSLIEAGKEAKGAELIKTAKSLSGEVAGKLEKEYFEKAQKLMETRDFKAAQKLLLRVIRINPDNTKAQETLKRLFSLMKIMEKTK